MKIIFTVLILSTIAFVQADYCSCRLRTSKRIVNGQISIKNSIPWIVSLGQNNEHFCGGSILNEKFILTSASCLDKRDHKTISVRVGIQNVNDIIPQNQTYQVKKVHTNKFKGVNVAGNIAILELTKNIEFVDGIVEKGCFNLEKKEYPELLLAAGWGMTEVSCYDTEEKKWTLDGKPDNLKQAFFKQLTECSDFFICVKPLIEGDSICQGDDGGPIHYTENGFTKIEGLAGYASGTKKIEDKDYYCAGNAVYSRLSYYTEWINKVTDHNFCGASEKKKGFKLF